MRRRRLAILAVGMTAAAGMVTVPVVANATTNDTAVEAREEAAAAPRPSCRVRDRVVVRDAPVKLKPSSINTDGNRTVVVKQPGEFVTGTGGTWVRQGNHQWVPICTPRVAGQVAWMNSRHIRR